MNKQSRTRSKIHTEREQVGKALTASEVRYRRTGSGNVCRFCGVEKALTASEVRYRRLFESAKAGILLLDANTGQVTDVNPFLIKTLGYSQEELVGKTIWEIGPFKEIAASKAAFLELQSKEYIRYEDLPLETKDGHKIEVEFVSSVFRVNHHKVIQCNIRDITARKRTEEALARQAQELARSNAELEQFARIASHDLQEPLRMVESFTQLLARRYKGKLDADADEFIGYAMEGARRMRRLINDLLEYSRVGTQGKALEPTNCEALFDEAVANLATAIEQNGAVVTRDHLQTVMADASQLTQLFQNLIGNAIKFHGEEPPRVHVSAERSGKEWVFSVEDNGIGIDSNYYNRIFVIFQRLHSRSEYPGTGIGLAICRKIVERHGGRIWVDSELGKGATFYFTIPAT